jgi:peroxin-12
MSSQSSDDIYRPSFFEMVASDRFIYGLKPALKHILNVLSTRHYLFHKLLKYHEEIFYGSLYILEKHYLEQYGTIKNKKQKKLKIKK